MLCTLNSRHEPDWTSSS